MSDNKYPPGGILFKQDRKRSEKAPDYSGNISIDRATLDYLVQLDKEGSELKLDLAGWKKESRSGSTFISLRASKPFVREGGEDRREDRGRDDRGDRDRWGERRRDGGRDDDRRADDRGRDRGDRRDDRGRDDDRDRRRSPRDLDDDIPF